MLLTNNSLSGGSKQLIIFIDETRQGSLAGFPNVVPDVEISVNEHGAEQEICKQTAYHGCSGVRMFTLRSDYIYA